jgi:hypothetical protein
MSRRKFQFMYNGTEWLDNMERGVIRKQKKWKINIYIDTRSFCHCTQGSQVQTQPKTMDL